MVDKFDCKVAFDAKLCKGNCCGCVPIKKEFYEKYKHKAELHIDEWLDYGGDYFIPLTFNGVCTFLQKDYSCGVYDDRPKVCRQFGTTETNIHLTCPYLKPSGALRSVASYKKISRLQNKATMLKLGNFKK